MTPDRNALSIRSRWERRGLRARPTVHQFHASSAYGDAVSNSLLFTKRLLRDLGFHSEVYVEHIHPRLEGQLRHSTDYHPSPDNTLLVHHSMGHDRIEWLLGLPDRKILVYHNITPPEFFPDDPRARKYSAIGREQLKLFRSAVAASICVSRYNADELVALGYENVSVVPLLFDPEATRTAPWDKAVADANADVFTVLFVGRVERNKCQHDVLRVFRHVARWLDRPAQLVFVGHYNPYTGYLPQLQDLARIYGIADRVKIVGHVPTEELLGWYRAADVFLCMSEHEGFGVPLIEAMIFDVPVIAYASSNIPHTLGGAGILVREKVEEEIAALVCLLAEDRALRRAIVARQRARVERFSEEGVRAQLSGVLAGAGVRVPEASRVSAAPTPRPCYQIEGPFESSYSLAIVNRELALALERQVPGRVSLFATEGPGDYEPDERAIRALAGLEPLWKRGRKRSTPDVAIRNLYPPRVADMDGLINVLQLAWEESAIDPEWVLQFNRRVDAIVVPSTYVKKVLIDAGVHVPVRVIGHGLDHVRRAEPQTYGGALGHGFRFLHVSSSLPRKGIDVLLRAYAKAFSDRDTVTLVIKTVPNVHNRTKQQVHALQVSRRDCPAVIVIDEDVPDAQLFDIYQRCHAFVAPSRGEGFGLPIAEAMAFGLPVITTAFGGHRDFCAEDNAWLVDYRFARSESHLNVPDSVWVEPDIDELARAMRVVFESPPDQIREKTERARAVVAELTWDRTASLLRAAEAEVASVKPLAARVTRLGWVTTWNSKCGIAAYSRYLLSELPADRFTTTIFASRKDVLARPDEPNVRRCWDNRANPSLADLERAVLEERVDALVLQFNFALFELQAFGALVERLSGAGVRVVVMFHSTEDVDGFSLGQIRAALGRADRLLVHGVDDLNTLKRFGLVHNATLFPQGVLARSPREPSEVRPRLGLPLGSKVVATYGFLLPHKGTETLIQALPAVLEAHPDTLLLLVNALYPVPESHATREACRQLIERLGLQDHVRMINDFLEDEESLALLECADLVVFPYQSTAESASAAVRMGLASGRAVACTPLSIFHDVAEAVHVLPGTRPADVATGIVTLLEDVTALNATRERQERWLRAHSWAVLARRLGGMIHGLVGDAQASAAAPVAAQDTGDDGGRTLCSA